MTRQLRRYPALAEMEGVFVQRQFCRIVPDPVLRAKPPPDFLFTSGKPGRYNPRGIHCLYASEDMAVAGQECERYREAQMTTFTAYWVYVSALVLDLGNQEVLVQLGLKETDLYLPWRFASQATPTQLLGAEMAMQNRIGGIRFPSDAARERHFVGFNIVLYKDAIRSPAEVVVRSDSGADLAKWPLD